MNVRIKKQEKNTLVFLLFCNYMDELERYSKSKSMIDIMFRSHPVEMISQF